MAKKKRYPLGTFIKEFGTEGKSQEYLVKLRWRSGFVCPKCGCRHAHMLATPHKDYTQVDKKDQANRAQRS